MKKKFFAIIVLSLVSIFTSKAYANIKPSKIQVNNQIYNFLVNQCLVDDGLITRRDKIRFNVVTAQEDNLSYEWFDKMYKTIERDLDRSNIDEQINKWYGFKNCDELWSFHTSKKGTTKEARVKLIKKIPATFDRSDDEDNKKQSKPQKNNLSDKKAREKCIKAKDYAGCMEYESSEQ